MWIRNRISSWRIIDGINSKQRGEGGGGYSEGLQSILIYLLQQREELFYLFQIVHDDESVEDNNGKMDDGGNILTDLEATVADIGRIKLKQK
eukprot:1229996-Ditylum_brightwellii.AAC.1